MKFTNKKRGFTIVELIIVIAVIAVLAAVLIPVFSGLIQQGKDAEAKVVVNTLNKGLAMTTTKPATMQFALEAVETNVGINVAKLDETYAKTGNKILWDSEYNTFLFVTKDGEKVSAPNVDKFTDNEINLWAVAKTTDDLKDNYSHYWYGGDVAAVEVATGFDAGVANIGTVNYVNAASAKNVTIRTNGGTLTVNAPNDTVTHYGKADKVVIEDVAPHSYYENGAVKGNLEIKKGHVEVAANAEVGTVLVTAEVENAVSVKVNENASIGVIAATTTVGQTYIKSASTIPSDKVMSSKVDETVLSKFAGGVGTVASPYLVANAEQLLNIITAESGRKNIKLIDDIDLTNATVREYDGMKFYVGKEYKSSNVAAPYLYEHVVDGDGHSIYTADDVSFCGSLRYTTLKNIVFHLNGKSSIALESEGATSLINITTMSDKGVVLTNNEAIYIRRALTKTANITMKDCKNYANITSDATNGNYNGILVGSYTAGGSKAIHKLTVENFENYGNISCGKTALIGNIYRVGKDSTMRITANGIKNYGLIKSFYAPANQYIATEFSYSTILTIDGSVRTTDYNVLTGFVSGSADEKLAIAKNADGTLAITASNNSNVSYYVVSIGIYTRVNTDNTTGTDQIAVCEKIQKFDSTKNTTIKVLDFINITATETTTALSGVYSSRGDDTIKLATVNGKEYYVLNVTGEIVDGVVKVQNRMITVTAYDESGNPLSSAIVSD